VIKPVSFSSFGLFDGDLTDCVHHHGAVVAAFSEVGCGRESRTWTVLYLYTSRHLDLVPKNPFYSKKNSLNFFYLIILKKINFFFKSKKN
jgi:hypothetical protein